MRDKVIVGYDLGNLFSQISYCSYGEEEPQTLSVIAGGNSYNIPTVLCKRTGLNQWFFGKDAIKHAQDADGVQVDNLVEAARAGKKIPVEEEEFDAVLLLTLFMKRSLSLLNIVSSVDKIGALMITCKNLDGRMLEVLEEVAEGLSLKTKRIFFQGHEESVFAYMMRQPEELWKQQVLVFDYEREDMECYRMTCNRNTSPVAVFVEKETYPFLPNALPEGLSEEETQRLRDKLYEQLDGRFLGLLEEICEGRFISSLYLVGEGFSEDWLKESLRFACRGRRIFTGNNLYSRGACYGLKDRVRPPQEKRAYAFLGQEKLKANIGMRLFRQGEISYMALLNAGENWYETYARMELLLEEEDGFTLIVTPLNGSQTKQVSMTLNGLPRRAGIPTRIAVELKMTSESIVEITAQNLGFGELFPSENEVWTESFEVR